MTEKYLKKFSETVLKIGVNLQKDQGLEILCPVEKHKVALVMSETAYKLGASVVNIRWEYEKADRLKYLYASDTALKSIPKWLVDQRNYLVKNNFCYVAIAAEDPSAFTDVPAERIATSSIAKSKALKKFSDAVMANAIRWCVVSVPTDDWAKKVFPDSEDPEKELGDRILKTMRLNAKDPVSAWEKHIAEMNAHAEFMNSKNFEYLIYKSSAGTDFKVGLCNDHVWVSAQEKAKDGVPFVANMPTEEIFTAPHRLKAEGTVRSAMPLCYNGQIIDNFTLTFRNGKIVGYTAEKGYDTLKSLIETDKGTLRLGEVALIGKNSPIAKTGTLFYNTLFDENASCHIAIGKGYPTTVKNGADTPISELRKKGLNDSVEHVDFMIGTKDLSVIGVEKDGTETVIFKNGDWAI